MKLTKKQVKELKMPYVKVDGNYPSTIIPNLISRVNPLLKKYGVHLIQVGNTDSNRIVVVLPLNAIVK